MSTSVPTRPITAPKGQNKISIGRSTDISDNAIPVARRLAKRVAASASRL
ncbi:MAG: hypothetical protein QM778_01540 [Myxococcales bacterium]